MDLKELRYFIRVYEEKSINKAATQLFITPQGLSKMIQHLEEDLHTKLFIRSMKGMEPTESGIYLYQHAYALLQTMEQIKSGIQRIQEKEKYIQLGYASGVLHMIPLQFMEQFSYDTGMQMQWIEAKNEDIRKKVYQKELDIGFVIGSSSEKDFVMYQMFERSLRVIVNKKHPFYQKDQLYIQDLKNESIITLNENYHCYHSFKQRCADMGFQPTIVAKTMESKLIYKLCQQGLGIGIDVNLHMEDVEQYELKSIPLVDAIPWKVYMIWRKDQEQYDYIRKVLAYLRKLSINK